MPDLGVNWCGWLHLAISVDLVTLWHVLVLLFFLGLNNISLDGTYAGVYGPIIR